MFGFVISDAAGTDLQCLDSDDTLKNIKCAQPHLQKVYTKDWFQKKTANSDYCLLCKIPDQNCLLRWIKINLRYPMGARSCFFICVNCSVVKALYESRWFVSLLGEELPEAPPG